MREEPGTRLTLPWVVLAHDNHRLTPNPRGKGLIAASAYRRVKANAALVIQATWRGAPIIGPVEVHGIAYFPDARKRDCGNYRKLITDALSGIAYQDDSQVHREVWERGPIDRENPRMELTVSPLALP